jgi:hypothetical protein
VTDAPAVLGADAVVFSQPRMREIFFIRLADGKISDMTATWNSDDLREQLGVLGAEPGAGLALTTQPRR